MLFVFFYCTLIHGKLDYNTKTFYKFTMISNTLQEDTVLCPWLFNWWCKIFHNIEKWTCITPPNTFSASMYWELFLMQNWILLSGSRHYLLPSNLLWCRMFWRWFYHSYFHSVVTYVIIFWVNFTHSDSVFKLQKRIISIIMSIGLRNSCRELFQMLNILPLITIYIFSCTFCSY